MLLKNQSGAFQMQKERRSHRHVSEDLDSGIYNSFSLPNTFLEITAINMTPKRIIIYLEDLPQNLYLLFAREFLQLSIYPEHILSLYVFLLL